VPAVLWGVAFANIVHGVPIDADKEYTGTASRCSTPFGLLGGLVTLTLFLTHGAMFVALKTDGEIRQRASGLSVRLGVVAAVVAVVFLVWTQVDTGSLGSAVLFVLAAVAPGRGHWLAHLGREGWAFVGTFATIALAVAGLFVALFPDVMPTTLADGVSLTTTNASATAYTLKVMTWVAVIFTPIVLGYQAWTYWVFRRGSGPTTSRPPSSPADEAARPTPAPPPPPGPHSARRGTGRGAVSGLLTVAQAFALGTLVVDVVTAPAARVAHAGAVAGGRRPGRRRQLVRRRRGHRSRLRPGLQPTCAPRAVGDRGGRPTGPVAPTYRRAHAARHPGLAGIEPYLTRYLPSLVLATVLPIAALLAIVWLDPLSGLVVALTLPLVPLFAVLVGIGTRDRAARQWRRLSALAGHFLDVVRGLPTLVVHRRATAQSAPSAG
jgi:hypothetical protein